MLDIKQAKLEIEKAPSNDERLRLLLVHSKDFYRNAPKEAEKWAKEALKLATKLKDEEGIARAHLYLGFAKYQLCDYEEASKEFEISIKLDRPDEFQNPLLEGPIFSLGLTFSKQGKYKEAIEHYVQALRISRKNHRKSEIDILGAIGNAALEQGDYPKALRYQYESLSILDAIDDPLRRSIVFSNIGWIYLEVQDLGKADVFFERSYLLKKEVGDTSGLDTTIYNRGLISLKLNDRIGARKLFEEALKLALKVGRKESEAYIEDSLGSIEMTDGRPAAALKHFNRAVKIASALNLRTVWCVSLIGKGRALVALKKPLDGIKSLKESLIMSDESGLRPIHCECVGALASAHEAAGKLKDSILYFNKFIALNAEVHNEKQQRSLVEISARVEIEKADRERARMEIIAKDADNLAAFLKTETDRQSKELTTLALQLVEKNEFLCNLKEEIEPALKSSKKAKEIAGRIDSHIKSDRDWETFENQFDQVHYDFVNRLAASYPALTPMEIKVAVLIKLNLPTKAIANLLCLSVRTVENHRQSIRRKLDLRGEGNLLSFLTGFGEAK